MLDDLRLIYQRDKTDTLGAAEKQWRKARLELASAPPELAQKLASLAPEIPTKRNLAKQLALELMGRSVVIYTGPNLAAAARTWKQLMNQTAKQLAWYVVYPDDAHDDLAAWSGQTSQKLYALVQLDSNLDDERAKTALEVAGRLLSGRRPAPNIVKVEGKTAAEQILYATTLARYVSIYLALLYNVEPGDSATIDKFKEAAGE